MGKDLRRQLESGSLRRGEPSYYQLLGLPEFEQDERKIYEAARSALEQARKLDRAQSARLVSRLLHARNTLTSPEQKADYDERLRNLRESQPAEIFKSAEHALDSLRRRMESGTKEEGKEEPATPAAVMVYVLLILVGIGFNYLMHRKFLKQAAHLRGFAEALKHFEQGDSGKALKTFRLLAESNVSAKLKKASASKVEEIELVQEGKVEVRSACSKMLETLFARPSSSTVSALKKVQKLLAVVSEGGQAELLPETAKVVLSVETIPPGAEVLAGSRKLGTTPLITAVEPFEGNMAVFMAEESYERLILPVRLAPSQKLGLRIEMFRLADLVKHPWSVTVNKTLRFTLPVEPDPGTVDVGDRNLVRMKMVGNSSRVLELTALGKAGETYIAFARNGKLLKKRLIVEPIEVKTVYPPRAVVAVAFRGEVYVGFSPEPKNRAVTVIRYEIFRKPDKQGRPESSMLGRVSAPQGEHVDMSLPEAFERLPETSRIAKRAFWYRDTTIKGENTYVYGVRAVAVDADPPLSPLVSTEPVPTPYETDMRLTGGGGGRGVFEILKWTRQGWKMQRFSVIVGNEIGKPKKDKTGITVDFRTGYKLLSLDMSARKPVGKRYIKGKAICEDENGNKLELWRGSFGHGAASETIRQQIGKGKRLGPKPPPGKNGDTEPEPEELKPD